MRSDAELVEAINGGDAEAFETLYGRYRDWVHRLAWRFTDNEEDALDVLQETFFYLLKKFPGLELRSAMTTFLYPVVRHLALNLHRRKSPTLASDTALGKIPAPQASDTSRTELAQALSALSYEQQEVVLMRFVDDMALAEIAKALEIPLNTVKSRLYYALQKLRRDPRTRDYFLDK